MFLSNLTFKNEGKTGGCHASLGGVTEGVRKFGVVFGAPPDQLRSWCSLLGCICLELMAAYVCSAFFSESATARLDMDPVEVPTAPLTNGPPTSSPPEGGGSSKFTGPIERGTDGAVMFGPVAVVVVAAEAASIRSTRVPSEVAWHVKGSGSTSNKPRTWCRIYSACTKQKLLSSYMYL